MYSEKVLEHFRKPKGSGKMENPDGVGKVGNVVCGDIMWLYIRVGKNRKGREVIKDISWETFGCIAAIATSSMIRRIAKGKTLEEAMKITNRDVLRGLGNLPPIKVHCSVLAADGLSEAIYDFLSKKGRKVPGELQKKHERMQKEIQTIEEKYKDFFELEKKAHEGG